MLLVVENMINLPQTAKQYIERIEELTKTKVGIISTSPEREDTIIIK